MTPSQHDLERLYDLLDQFRNRLGGERRLADCRGRQGWPTRGVYFFFEPGETRADGMGRVVRVGTHALTTTSRTTLWQRLAQHRGSLNGGHGGGGNHRGSIFRLHVGAALLRRDGDPDGIAATWGRHSSAPAQVRAAERPHEQRVSAYIGAMPFLWVTVDDPPGPDSDRALIEAGAIGLLSRRSNPRADCPSPQWLGRHADRETIRTSGLWNVRHVDDRADPAFLGALSRWAART